MVSRRRGLRGLLGLLGLLALACACAPRTGWQPTLQRSCATRAPARLCVEATPDRPLRVELGGTAIVPGECAEAPEGGGLLRLTVDDGRSGAVSRRWIRLPRGRITWVRAVDGGVRLRVRGRARCGERLPVAPGEAP